MLERIFRLTENRTNVRTELLAGLTTFLTMAYIIFVNPSVLSTDFSGQPTGLDHGAVVLATCLAAALASCIMGFVARYPIALAPGMGSNFFFVSVVMALSARGVANAWQAALGVVFVAGVIFLVLSVLPVREWLLDSISQSLRHGIAVGIGVFIAFIGLRAGKVVVDSPGTLVTLNTDFRSPAIVVFASGFVVTAVLHALRVRGAIVLGILFATGLALALGEVSWPERVLGLPEVKRGAVFQHGHQGGSYPHLPPVHRGDGVHGSVRYAGHPGGGGRAGRLDPGRQAGPGAARLSLRRGGLGGRRLPGHQHGHGLHRERGRRGAGWPHRPHQRDRRVSLSGGARVQPDDRHGGGVRRHHRPGPGAGGLAHAAERDPDRLERSHRGVCPPS